MRLSEPHGKIGANVRLGEGVVIEPGVMIGDDVAIGHFSVIKSGTVIGNGVTIGDLVVLGKRPSTNRNWWSPTPRL